MGFPAQAESLWLLDDDRPDPAAAAAAAVLVLTGCFGFLWLLSFVTVKVIDEGLEEEIEGPELR